MKSIKTIKICKRNKIAKDKADLKFRGYTNDQLKSTESMLNDINILKELGIL